jgi:hypothetical protein
MRALGGSYTKESSCVSWFHVKRIFFSKPSSLADQHAKEISGSHGGQDDEVVLLDCGAV